MITLIPAWTSKYRGSYPDPRTDDYIWINIDHIVQVSRKIEDNKEYPSTLLGFRIVWVRLGKDYRYYFVRSEDLEQVVSNKISHN